MGKDVKKTMTKIQTEYEGWSITYEECSDDWKATKEILIDGIKERKILLSPQLSSLKTNIKAFENRLKRPKKSKRLKCLHLNYNGTYDAGEITSTISRGWGSLRVRVTLINCLTGDKFREEYQLKELIKETEENRGLLEKIKSLSIEQKKLEEKLIRFIDDDAKALESEED